MQFRGLQGLQWQGKVPDRKEKSSECGDAGRFTPSSYSVSPTLSFCFILLLNLLRKSLYAF